MAVLFEVLLLIGIPMLLIAWVGRMIPPLGRFLRRFGGGMFLACLGAAIWLAPYDSGRGGLVMIPLVIGIAFLFYGEISK